MNMSHDVKGQEKENGFKKRFKNRERRDLSNVQRQIIPNWSAIMKEWSPLSLSLVLYAQRQLIS